MELKTIEKALLVLKRFSRSNNTLSTTELAGEMGITKATMSRILTTLKKHEFLEQDPDTRRYQLGPAIAIMSRAVNRSLNGEVLTIAKPFADKLRDEVGESVHIEILSGNNIYLAYQAQPKNPISLTVGIGDRVMPHAHSGAKAIAAFREPEEIDRWLDDNNLPSLTKRTQTSPEKLKEIYRKIREEGIAYDWEEYLPEVNAIAAPIFNHQNKAVAAVLIVVPTYRLGKKWDHRFIVNLKQTANEISKRLFSSKSI